jgi:lipoprotein-anchoring transpeptidase ErfK/SrfK
VYVSVSTLRGVGAAAMAVTLAAGAAGCTGNGSEAKAAPPPSLTVLPADASAKVRPDTAINVATKDGTIQNVTVTTKGRPVEGALSADGRNWRSRWRLNPGARYDVAATVLGRDGRTRTVTSGFTTAKVERAVTAQIEAPFAKETVGVGMPIILRFDREITEKAEVERALVVTADKPVQGAWHWFGDQSVVFRTKDYWPRFTKVHLTAHLTGVRVAKNVYGTKNLDLSFQVGERQTSKASAKTHRMLVYRNGKKIRNFPISMGRGGIYKYTTTNGNHLTMDKGNPVIMDSSTVGCPPGCPDYYRQVVYYSVRISNSGEYTHSAPWSVGSQGHANVSHGCINMAPADARWFYNSSRRGDPYKVTGTKRELEPENGWGYWQLSWADWVKGSSLKQPVTVGPLV